MTSSRSLLRGQSGQLTVEAILILALLTSVTIAASREFRGRRILQTATAGPWSFVRGMIQNGIWDPSPRNPKHPNSVSRHATASPE